MTLARFLRNTGASVLLGALISACVSTGQVEPVPTAAAPPTPTVRATEAPAVVSVPTPVLTPVPTPVPTLTPPAPTAVVATVQATPRIVPPTATAVGSQEQVRSPDVATAITLLAVQFESALNRGDVEAALAMFE